MKEDFDYKDWVIINKLSESMGSEVLQLRQIAEEVSKKVHCDIKGSCVGFAELFVIKAYQKDPDLLKQFDIIEGYVLEDKKRNQHTWIRTKDGENIDPTIRQFKDQSKYDTKIKKVYTGEKYFEDTVRIHKLDINNLEDTKHMTLGRWYKNN